MRVDIFVPSDSVEDQVRFYVDKLQLFTVAHDYGMGEVLLRHVAAPSICLQLAPGQLPNKRGPLFCLSIEDCEREFVRLRAISFSKGGLVSSPSGQPRILEYPLGKSFSVRDASGNIFLFMEWHPSAA